MRVQQKAQLRRIVVTAADGRTWDLGRPSHPLIGDRLFKIRRRRYLLHRRAEIEAQGGNVEEMI